MKICGRMLIAVWLWVAVQTSLVAQPAAPFPAERAAAIEAQVRKCMEEHGIPGLSIAMAADDRLVFSRGFGLSDVENQGAGHGRHGLSHGLDRQDVHGRCA